MKNITKMVVMIGSDGPPLSIKGRMAWALSNLLAAGEFGCTPITHPGPRWSDYILKIRRTGITVETVTEAHDGPYRGHHAKYVLRTPVTVLSEEAA